MLKFSIFRGSRSPVPVQDSGRSTMAGRIRLIAHCCNIWDFVHLPQQQASWFGPTSSHPVQIRMTTRVASFSPHSNGEKWNEPETSRLGYQPFSFSNLLRTLGGTRQSDLQGSTVHNTYKYSVLTDRMHIKRNKNPGEEQDLRHRQAHRTYHRCHRERTHFHSTKVKATRGGSSASENALMPSVCAVWNVERLLFGKYQDQPLRSHSDWPRNLNGFVYWIPAMILSNSAVEINQENNDEMVAER